MQVYVGVYVAVSVFLIVIFSFLYSFVQENIVCEYCNDNCDDIAVNNYMRLSTKTPYRAVQNNIAEEITFPGCYANKIWGLFRHGTRTSKEKHKKAAFQLNGIMEFIQKINGTSDRSRVLLDAIKSWRTHEDFNDGHQSLTDEGEREMFHLGRRYFLRFPDIFKDSYRKNDYVLRYTHTQRTNSSAYHFASGIFGNNDSVTEYNMELVPDNQVIRFYKDCKRWRNSVKKNYSVTTEQRLFIQSNLMQNLIEDIGQKLEYKEPLTFDLVRTMYMTCCYETAWRKYYDLSPWCKAFNDTQLQIMEYCEDIRYYWVDGYGHLLNRQLPCVLFNNAVQYLMFEDGGFKSSFSFTHSGTVLKFLAYLGLYRDEKPLQHDNYEEMRNRRWRTSKIDPFGTNIAFVSYMCGNEQFILTMHQERPVILPGCPSDNYLCPASTIYDLYKETLSNCNVDAMCAD